MNLKQKQTTRLSTLQKVVLASGVSALVIGLIFFIGKTLSPDIASAGVCDGDIKNTQTLSTNTSCSDIKVDGGTLYIEAELTLSGDLEIKDGGTVIIRNGGSLNAKKLKVKEESSLEIYGDVAIDEEFKIEGDDASVVLSEGYEMSVGKKFEFKDESTFQVAGTFNFTGNDESKIKDGSSFIVLNHGTVNLTGDGKFKLEEDSKLDINPGGWLFVSEAEFKEGSDVINNGYFEQTSTSKKIKFDKTSMTGNGVFYCLKKNKVQLTGGAKIFNGKKSSLSDDQFNVGSTQIAVKRLPKFKIEADGWELADTLVVTDTIDLNGKNLDIKNNDFTLPKSFSYARTGNVSEYIKTSSTGKYNLKILKNNVEHIAPIGRNPYLPVHTECTDCQGTEFAVSVTQNVYLNPETRLPADLQTANAIGETWSIIPSKDVSGSITFQLQWNDGTAGTTSSELPNFTRSNATARMWTVGQSTKWEDDGVNVGVQVSGTSPNFMITYVVSGGLTQGQEYLFSVGSTGSALPVEFLFFDAKEKAGKVELTWATAMELNNDFFEIQRSTDGLNWEALEKVDGFGTTKQQQDYIAYDQNPKGGLNYYRLKQVDYDGTVDYSDVRQVAINGNNAQPLEITSIYPNPFTDFISVDLKSPNDGNAQLQLFNSSGVLLQTKTQMVYKGAQSIKFNDLSSLETGAYVLVVSLGEERITKTILKR
jgi:hypothetical protein